MCVTYITTITNTTIFIVSALCCKLYLRLSDALAQLIYWWCEYYFLCHSLQSYQLTLTNPQVLNPVISLLEQTSKLVRVSNDRMCIRTKNDPRLTEIRDIIGYFEQFEGKPTKQSFTRETLYDIKSALEGLLEFVDSMLTKQIRVIPAFINSDILENHFCLVRTLFNGPSRHPSYAAYMAVQNSIILTQPTGLPTKRNAEQYVEPFCQY